MFKYVNYTTYEDEYTTHEFTEINEKCKVHRFDVPYVSVECETEEDFTELMATQHPNIEATEISMDEFSDMVQHSDQVQRMYNRANELYTSKMNPANIRYPASERETWPQQVAEAETYLDTGVAGEMITALAAANGMSIDAYANGVIANKAEYDSKATQAMSDKTEFLKELKAEVGIFGDTLASWAN